jgi:hypothetical protein
MLHLKRRWILVVCLLAAILFYFENRRAYRGYFSEDDLDTLSWATITGGDSFFMSILSPNSSDVNFRPVGDLYYRFIDLTFKRHYPPFVIGAQVFHVVNVMLLFLLLVRLGFSQIAAGAGVLFYAFHAALLEAYWKPMFIFDVLCATFCLVALLLYLWGHWILALAPFWLAYKSKELAVMLPLGLLGYELYLGQRNWKRLVPYFAISLTFGLQALWYNSGVAGNSPYVLRLTQQGFLNTAGFYSSCVLFVPYVGLALFLMPLWLRDRRLYFGLFFCAAMFVPLLVLPNRMFAVYWYVPLIGIAIAVAAIAAITPRWAIAAFLLLWLPMNYLMARDTRREVLAEGDLTRSVIAALKNYARQIPLVHGILYENVPEHMHAWGVSGAISQVFGPHIRSSGSRDAGAKAVLADVPNALISFYPNPLRVKGIVRTRDQLESYVRFSDKIPESQFGTGWYDVEGVQRWIKPRADVTLHKPSGAMQFEIVGFLPPSTLQEEGPAKVTVLQDGHSLGTMTLSESSIQPLRWKVVDAAGGDKRITIVCDPPRHGQPGDVRQLGIAVSAIGYVPASRE